MKRTILFLSFTLLCFSLISQPKKIPKKYPSLLWEISGNGLKNPSYLFGTMHVSSKIAFHLSDSFYVGIRNAQVVALETNPESWQEDMNKYETDDMNNRYPDYGPAASAEIPDDYLTIRTLRFDRYEKSLETALFSRPAVINNLLYRSYSDYSSDFEEDTYLDMYIYQTGKKLGKRIAGVENYGESMRLMAEAYSDAAKEKNRKEKSYDYDEEYAPAKLQEAYRTGNLDLLDSINRLNSFSDAFDEKFLYRRNEIQASSIDSILKKSKLFVGVGAAHLPGTRGLVELLRKKGYKLRPILMDTRDSRHKELVEKIRVPVNFSTYTAADGFYKVDIPGKFYGGGEYGMPDQQQYADMANGSYYMVTRVKTNGLFWGHREEMVAKKIDSLLYENVPGKILSKTEITRNGYKGFDIVNRTRRGDYQRYHIFITPFEALFFKMSGNGDYVKNGDEAKKFFSSIQLRELKNGGWKKFQPSWGGFAVLFPHEPLETFYNDWQFDAEEKSTGSHYTVIKTGIHNYNFTEEDTFDLTLLDESFASSEFIAAQLSRNQTIHKGYPALDCRYRHRDSSLLVIRHIIQGPHYYTLIAHAKKENAGIQQFLNSFEIKPFIYGEVKKRTDTALHFTVSTAWYPGQGKLIIDIPGQNSFEETDNEAGYAWPDRENFKNKLIANDTTGEKIFINFYKSHRYFYSKDSIELYDRTDKFHFGDDSSWIVRSKTKTTLPDKTKIWEMTVSDTGSSRVIRAKIFYRDGIAFSLMTQTDTLSQSSSFIKNFFETFTPSDSLKGISPFQKKTKSYFDDFFSGDSIARKTAIRSIALLKPDSANLPDMKKAISSFKWSDKKYLDTKKGFISKLAEIKTKESSDYLKNLYYAAGDTVELQYTALEALLKQRNQYAFNLFRDIITTEPPVLEGRADGGQTMYPPLEGFNRVNNYLAGISNGNFLDELYDSLKLTRTILPDLLPLMNLDDYKWPVMRLLKTMVDSSLVTAKNYEIYFSKFLIEAKQELKKQTIGEKKKAIEKAEEDKEEKKNYGFYAGVNDNGNAKLNDYATLLLPFYDTHPGVQLFLQQLLQSNDKRLRYNTAILLLQHQRPLPDTLLRYFANEDEYRYELYSHLKQMKMAGRFPAERNNHIDLGRSRLLLSRTYNKPDSLIYLDKKSAEYKGNKGYILFFKYNHKKGDAAWKIAAIGLIPEAANQFEFEKKDVPGNYMPALSGIQYAYNRIDHHDFLEFSDEKIKDDEPLQEQLGKLLKRMLYSKRKSGRMFYRDNDGGYDFTSRAIIEK
jgi:uncharacterized protein YbaP (TraB family)